MNNYKKVEKQLLSLENSTNLTIELKGETFEFTNRNSPYITRQGCNVAAGHDIPKVVIFRNESVTVVISTAGHLIGENVSPAFKMPGHMFKKLFQFPARPPLWLDGLVNCYVIDDFIGYDDNGNPEFAVWEQSSLNISNPIKSIERNIVLRRAWTWDIIEHYAGYFQISCENLKRPEYWQNRWKEIGENVGLNQPIPVSQWSKLGQEVLPHICQYVWGIISKTEEENDK